MNKTELKKFAIQSRRQLIDQVKTKALMYGIDEKNDLEIQEQFGQLMINDKPYPLYIKPAFNSLKNQLKQKGYKQLVEEVAYTWFNRIIAIRYMEIHDYLPEKVNVLSSSVGRVDPDILFEYETMDLPIIQEEIRELLAAGDTEGAYHKLFIAQCNTLNSILPFLFEQIQDYTELLLPDFLLDAQSVIKILAQNDELTNSFEEIEVIGWLYQYYIAEEKDRVFAQKSKYKKEEIPFATQLFTPKWIVQYMVQNSLGRYWTEAHREDEDLISNWEYFIKHEEDFHEKIAPYVNKQLRVEDIKLLDPAMGSGHILVYAFEVFHQIYEKCGYPERDIPRLILENNLYGLDIDDRAYQLAAFAIVMKAASYSRRFLRGVEREGIQLNLASIQEANHISDDVIAYIAQGEIGDRYSQVKAFFNQYYYAKTYGSLINITERDITFIEERLEHIQNNPVEDLFYGEQHDIAKEVLQDLVQQTKIMRNKYDVVVMNPPYMGASKMISTLSAFLKDNYQEGKADLFTAFMLTNHYLTKNGFYAAINQHSWMFLYTFENLRQKIAMNNTIDTMLHLGPRTFEEISGEVVQSTAYVLRNYLISNIKTAYYRLTDFGNSIQKRDAFLKNINDPKGIVFKRHISYFEHFPDKAMCYWAENRVRDIYKNTKMLTDYFDVKSGIRSGKDPLHLRVWYEVDKNKIKFDCQNYSEMGDYKWFPINKGGEMKAYFGNNQYIINLENDGENIKKYSNDYRLREKELYFLPGLTWSRVSTSNIGFRESLRGVLFGDAGPVIFIKDEEKSMYMLGLLNSIVSKTLLNYMNPTLNYQKRDIESLPIILEDIIYISNLTSENVEIAKRYWDYQEISWNFKKPAIFYYHANLLEICFRKRFEDYKSHINQLRRNIVKINEHFVSLYSLDEELKSMEDEELVTIPNVTATQDVKDILSYFIGCMVGRFEYDGLKYDKGIILLTEKQMIEKDILYYFKSFLSHLFGEDSLKENLNWIAKNLSPSQYNDNPEDIIYMYLFNDFFYDHAKTYQSIASKKKYPIYWMIDSGKNKALRVLFAMHSYQPDTLATIRFEHLQEIQIKYQNETNDLENRLVNPNLLASEKKKLTAEKTSFEKKMDELREFDQRLAEIAKEEIEIDLDDGVKVNYEKFYRGGKGVLAKIK